MLPVFGGGSSLFQPVYAGDIGRATELLSRIEDTALMESTRNVVIQAGGPDGEIQAPAVMIVAPLIDKCNLVLTYRELMQLVLKHTGRSRPIVSLPFAIGKFQGLVMERLPENILTITRAQASSWVAYCSVSQRADIDSHQVEQLKLNNVVSDPGQITSLYGERYTTLEDFIRRCNIEQKMESPRLESLDKCLPTYL